MTLKKFFVRGTFALILAVVSLPLYAQIETAPVSPSPVPAADSGLNLSAVPEFAPTEKAAPSPNSLPEPAEEIAPVAEGGDSLSAEPNATPTNSAPLPPTSPQSAPSASNSSTFFELVLAGGWIGGVIFLLSLAACSLAIQLLVTIRRPKLLPEELLAAFTERIERGRLQSAADACREHPSFLADVLLGGLKNFDGGWEDVEKGASEALGSETARLYRRTEFLLVIGNITPMLGLLGTVLGMVTSFGELAVSDGLSRFANLAHGIYFALVTTVDGLIVAIPTLAVYSFFNHRIASISSETARQAEELLRPLRRHFLAQKSPTASPPSVAPPSPPTPQGTERPNRHSHFGE